MSKRKRCSRCNRYAEVEYNNEKLCLECGMLLLSRGYFKRYGKNYKLKRWVPKWIGVKPA